MKFVDTLQIPCGQTYLLQTEDGHYVEAGDVFMSRETALGTRPYHFSDFDHPSDLEKRVMTVSTMAGCPCKCTFCSCQNTFKRKLTAREIVNQVYFMEAEGFIKHGRVFDGNNSKEFRVLYTRMGEPMLNIDNVIDSMWQLINTYPKIIIGMSTSGYKSGLDKLMCHLEIISHIDMQFSMHSTDQDQRDLLFDTTKNMALEDIARATSEWFHLTGKKVGLNFILFDHCEYDFIKLLDVYGFNKDHIWIRLSPWNEVQGKSEFRSFLKTEDVIEKKPVSNDQLKMVIDNLDRSRISYSYAPAIDEEIKYGVACGQALEAFGSITGGRS